jgi:hypothetical protein
LIVKIEIFHEGGLVLLILFSGNAVAQEHTTISPPPTGSNQPENTEIIKILSSENNNLPSPSSSPVNVIVSGKLNTITEITEHKSGKEKYKWLRNFLDAKITDWIIAIFTIAIAFFTAKLVSATIKLESATTQLVSGSDKTAERQLRAYVFIYAAKIEKHESGIGGWAIHITFKNSGSTPAYNVVIKAAHKFPVKETDEIFPLPNEPTTHRINTIPPGDITTTRINFNELPISWNEWAVFRDANQKAYIWGRMDYVDAFDKPRWITFQMVYHLGVVADFAFCDKGNDSDKETTSST